MTLIVASGEAIIITAVGRSHVCACTHEHAGDGLEPAPAAVLPTTVFSVSGSFAKGLYGFGATTIYNVVKVKVRMKSTHEHCTAGSQGREHSTAAEVKLGESARGAEPARTNKEGRDTRTFVPTLTSGSGKSTSSRAPGPLSSGE